MPNAVDCGSEISSQHRNEALGRTSDKACQFDS